MTEQQSSRYIIRFNQLVGMEFEDFFFFLECMCVVCGRVLRKGVNGIDESNSSCVYHHNEF